MRLKRPEKGAWQGNRLKHLSKNPLIKGVVGRFKDHVAAIVSTANPKTILDVGCGEGFNTIVVSKWVPDAKITAIDLEDEYITYAKKHHKRANVTYKIADLYKLPANKKYELVMCNQVLEHLDDYNKALDVLAERSNKWILLTVPREPWFRMANIARLRYLSRMGNTPGHVNNWTKSKFKKLVSRIGKIRRVKTSTFWTIVLIEKFN